MNEIDYKQYVNKYIIYTSFIENPLAIVDDEKEAQKLFENFTRANYVINHSFNINCDKIKEDGTTIRYFTKNIINSYRSPPFHYSHNLK